MPITEIPPHALTRIAEAVSESLSSKEVTVAVSDEAVRSVLEHGRLERPYNPSRPAAIGQALDGMIELAIEREAEGYGLR